MWACTELCLTFLRCFFFDQYIPKASCIFTNYVWSSFLHCFVPWSFANPCSKMIIITGGHGSPLILSSLTWFNRSNKSLVITSIITFSSGSRYCDFLKGKRQVKRVRGCEDLGLFGLKIRQRILGTDQGQGNVDAFLCMFVLCAYYVREFACAK